MVHGVRVPLCVLLATVLLFTGTAAGAGGTDPNGDAAEGITWFAPETVAAGHPVHAAVAVLSGDGYATMNHQNLAVWVTLNDEVLYYTESIHEHHGLHVLTVTPLTPGTLRLYASEPGAAHDHEERRPLAALGPPAPEPHGVIHEVTVTGSPLLVSTLLDLAPVGVHAGTAWQVETERTDVPFSVLMTTEDDDGRLIASAWAAGRDGLATQEAASSAIAATRMYLTSDPAGNDTIKPQSFEPTQEAVEQAIAPLPVPTPPVWVPPAEAPVTCDDADRRLVLDPDSLNPAIPTWQQWSDVRVHLLDTARLGAADPAPVYYEIHPLPTRTEGGASFALQAADPLGYAAFRATQLGPHALVVRDAAGGVLCEALFAILPGPGGAADDPGRLEVEIHPSPDTAGAHIALASIAADGSALPHYEFDTRVTRLADADGPAFLAWRGKLHGHQGEVAFQVTNLPPGTYEVRVYPSPQDAELAPLAADGDDGFVHHFSVNGTMDAEPEPMGEEEITPAPGFLLIALLAGLAGIVAARRRHA